MLISFWRFVVLVFFLGALFSVQKDGVAATVQGEVVLKSQVWDGVRFLASSKNINV